MIEWVEIMEDAQPPHDRRLLLLSASIGATIGRWRKRKEGAPLGCPWDLGHGFLPADDITHFAEINLPSVVME